MEIAATEDVALRIDHLGLIASTAKDLGLVEKLDARLPRYDVRRIVSAGESILAMILNGLGFSNRRLYLMPQFLQDKPVDRLMGKHLKAEHFDDHVLGRTLDEIAEYGATKLFSEIAFEIALENKLIGKMAHIDTTSLSFEGSYDNDCEEGTIQVTHGYSKDRRPDLKQVVLSLAVTGPSSMPILMNPQDGNASDKVVLGDGINLVREFKNQLHQGFNEFTWVADSALYTREKLLSSNDFLWISRVPETIGEAKDLLIKPVEDFEWYEGENGYRFSPQVSQYGGIEQRWILVFSQQAKDRELALFERKLKKEEEDLIKAMDRLKNLIFSCEEDAKNHLVNLMKKSKYFILDSFNINEVQKYSGKGRPKKTDVKQVVGYQINASLIKNDTAILAKTATKGRFILATNDLNSNDNPDVLILQSYKKQQDVERGFAFLKEPWFMANRIFLKSPKRIEALMMIMTLCLMIYNIAQYRFRKTLEEKNETIPNQLGKPFQKPTLKWIFQIMDGLTIVRLQTEQGVRTLLMNLNELRKKIISLFGGTAHDIYGTS